MALTRRNHRVEFSFQMTRRATVHRHASSVICTWFGLRKVAWIKEIAANFEKVALADQREDRLGRFLSSFRSLNVHTMAA
jgi:hypothetical protein